MTGRIPDSFIDELLARIDIVEVVGERVHLKKSGSNHLGLCPFHSEKTPSFTVAPSKQFYHCFGCGAHGTAIRFLMEYDRLEFRDAIAQLARMAGMEIPASARDETPERHTEIYRVLARAAEHYRGWLRLHPARDRAVDYLRQRGLTGEIAARFGIGFAPPGRDHLLRALGDRDALIQAGLVIRREEDGRVYDRFRDRIMFPIRDRRGRVIGFGGRVLGDGQPKYLNSPETPVFRKGQELYGLHEVLQTERRPADILIVEGYMDVVALAQHGLTRAVATLGTATSTQQVEQLFRVATDVVFCFDGDRAGRQAAWRALENTLPAMREGRQVRFLFLPEGEDPDSLVRHRGRDAFEALQRKARPLSDFLLERLTEDVDMTSRDSSTRLVDKAVPLLRRLPPDLFRRLLLERLAEITRLEAGYIEAVADGRAGRPAEVPRTRPVSSATMRRTPVRLAIALLLQRPGLASLVPDPDCLRELTLPGLPLLLQLLESARIDPHINTGALLERYRDTEHETALWKLATWDHMVPEDGIEQEFSGILDRLERLRQEQRLQYLNERLQQGDLTREEWSEWTQLKR